MLIYNTNCYKTWMAFNLYFMRFFCLCDTKQRYDDGINSNSSIDGQHLSTLYRVEFWFFYFRMWHDTCRDTRRYIVPFDECWFRRIIMTTGVDCARLFLNVQREKNIYTLHTTSIKCKLFVGIPLAIVFMSRAIEPWHTKKV